MTPDFTRAAEEAYPADQWPYGDDLAVQAFVKGAEHGTTHARQVFLDGLDREALREVLYATLQKRHGIDYSLAWPWTEKLKDVVLTALREPIGDTEPKPKPHPAYLADLTPPEAPTEATRDVGPAVATVLVGAGLAPHYALEVAATLADAFDIRFTS